MRQLALPSYHIIIGAIEDSLSAFLKDKSYSSVAVIVDENTKEHCFQRIEPVLPDHYVIQIPSGEQHKTLNTAQKIWSQMVQNNMDRHSLVINLGGGVIGDMGGYAASCYMRGVDFAQIPTTLLSQVDASVGGKLAVDFQGLKNFIGLFRDPNVVLVDPKFLKTLTPQELRSGYAEMIKHGLIQDVNIWNRLMQNDPWDGMDWEAEILESIAIKKKVVEADPFEKGLRKILNFGHTIGHAVETLSFSTDKPLLHGEAIAVGMAAEVLLSIEKCNLNLDDARIIIKHLSSVYSDIDLSILSRSDELINYLTKDKKNRGGRRLFSLLSAIGKSEYNVEVSPEEITASLSGLQNAWL